MRMPPHPPLSSCEPSVQMVPSALQFRAVSRAGPSWSIQKAPGRVQPSHQTWGSTASPGFVPAAALILLVMSGKAVRIHV